MHGISEDVREESSENEDEEPEEPASSSPRRETIQGLAFRWALPHQGFSRQGLIRRLHQYVPSRCPPCLHSSSRLKSLVKCLRHQ